MDKQHWAVSKGLVKNNRTLTDLCGSWDADSKSGLVLFYHVGFICTSVLSNFNSEDKSN